MEVSVFDHPVASGRVRIDDGIAVVGGLESETPGAGKGFERAVLAALADEAFGHGADTLYTILLPDQVANYTADGWTAAAHLTRFKAAR